MLRPCTDRLFSDCRRDSNWLEFWANIATVLDSVVNALALLVLCGAKVADSEFNPLTAWVISLVCSAYPVVTVDRSVKNAFNEASWPVKPSPPASMISSNSEVEMAPKTSEPASTNCSTSGTNEV